MLIKIIESVSKFNRMLLLLFIFIPVLVWSQETPSIMNTGHTDEILALAMSKDGQYLASGGKDNIIIVWDFLLGKEIARLKSHTKQINDLKFLNSNVLVSASEDGYILFWDIYSGKIIRSLFNKVGVKSIDISPDQSMLVSAGPYSPFKVWNLKDTSLVPYTQHSGICSSIAFNPQGEEIIYSINSKRGRGTYTFNFESKDKYKFTKKPSADCKFDKTGKYALYTYLNSSKIRFTDIYRGKTFYLRPGDYSKYKFITLDINTDYSLFASSSEDDFIYLFDMKSGKRKQLISTNGLHSYAIMFHPIMKDILIFSEGSSINVWDLTENKLVRKIEREVYPITYADLSSDGNSLLFAGTNNKVKVYNIKSNTITNCFSVHNAIISGLHYVSNSDTIVTVNKDNTMFYSQTTDSLKNHEVKIPRSPAAIINKIAAAAIPLTIGGNILTMYYLGKSVFIKSNRTLTTLAVSRDNNFTATGGGNDQKGILSSLVPLNHPIYIFDNSTQKNIFNLLGHYKPIKSLSFNYNGKYLASCGAGDQYIKIWDLQTKKIKNTYYNSNYFIQSIAFNSINDTLVFSNSQNNVFLFDLKKDTAILLSHGKAPLVFNNAGTKIFFQDQLNNIIEFDIMQRKVTHTFSGHHDLISSISFSKDGSKMLTSSWDGTLKLWDVNGGVVISTFLVSNKDINKVEVR